MNTRQKSDGTQGPSGGVRDPRTGQNPFDGEHLSQTSLSIVADGEGELLGTEAVAHLAGCKACEMHASELAFAMLDALPEDAEALRDAVVHPSRAGQRAPRAALVAAFVTLAASGLLQVVRARANIHAPPQLASYTQSALRQAHAFDEGMVRLAFLLLAVALTTTALVVARRHAVFSPSKELS